MLLPLLFVVVAALFTTLAQRMGREMALLPPLRAYTINLAGSLAGVIVLGLVSWLELPPVMWFGIALRGGAASAPVERGPGRRTRRGRLDAHFRSRPLSSILRCSQDRWCWCT